MSPYFPLPVVAILLLALVGCAPNRAAGPPPIPRPPAIDTYIDAVRAYDAGDKPRAVETLRQAIAANPKLTMARNLLARIYRDDNQYTQAVDQYEALVRMDQYWFENHFNLALCRQMLNELQSSAQSYLNALRLKPDDAPAHTNLALVYLSLNDLDNAERFARRAGELDPASARAFANLGVVLDARGAFTDAERAYLKSLELDSDQPATLLNYGTNLLMQNKPRPAINTLQRSLALQDSSLGHKRLGDAYFTAREYDAALREYNLALKLNPSYYPAMNQMGLILIAQYKEGLELDEQKRAAAVAIWRRSLEINPTQPRVQEWIRQWTSRELFGK